MAPGPPTNPELRAIASDVLAKLKYSMTIAAADEAVDSPGRVDNLFRQFLDTRDASSRERYRKGAKVLLDSPQAVRTRDFGRFAALDPKDFRSVGSDRVEEKVGPLSVDGVAVRNGANKWAKHIGLLVHNKPSKGLNLDADLLSGLTFKKMRLFVREVRIGEETDEVGSDEINMGGTMTDPFGNTSIINEFEVFTDADEGEAPAKFGWGKVLATWNIETQPAGFPYLYSALIALAEKDDGGFYKFLEKLWEMVGEMVTAAIGGAVGAAVGAAVGSAIPGIGTLVGALAGWLIGALIGWVISWFDNPDDIIAVKPLLMTLSASTKSYYDWAKLTSTEGWTQSVAFQGDGGRYKADFAWKVFSK